MSYSKSEKQSAPPSSRGRMSLKDYLDHLFKLAYDYEYEKASNPRLRNFIEHHTCTGVWNGSPVWRRLPSFYNRGKKYRLVSQGEA